MAPIVECKLCLECLMIERWMSLLHSSVCCIQLEGDGKVKISCFAGLPPKEVRCSVFLQCPSL